LAPRTQTQAQLDAQSSVEYPSTSETESESWMTFLPGPPSGELLDPFSSLPESRVTGINVLLKHCLCPLHFSFLRFFRHPPPFQSLIFVVCGRDDNLLTADTQTRSLIRSLQDLSLAASMLHKSNNHLRRASRATRHRALPCCPRLFCSAFTTRESP